MSQRSTALAAQFEGAVSDLVKTIEQCSDIQWAAVCNDEGWTVAQLAQHIAGQFPLEMEFITASAQGVPLPPYSWDDVNNKNDTRAARSVAATKADVLRELRSGAAWTSTYVRSLSDQQLDHTSPLPLAGGAMVSTEQLLLGGVLIEHVTGHLASIRSARPAAGATR